MELIQDNPTTAFCVSRKIFFPSVDHCTSTTSYHCSSANAVHYSSLLTDHFLLKWKSLPCYLSRPIWEPTNFISTDQCHSSLFTLQSSSHHSTASKPSYLAAVAMAHHPLRLPFHSSDCSTSPDNEASGPNPIPLPTPKYYPCCFHTLRRCLHPYQRPISHF